MTEIEYLELANFIKHLRKKNGLTQEFLASSLTISRPTYIQIENGERELTISEAQKLADIFGISFENFLAKKDAPCTDVHVMKDLSKEKNESENVRISIPQKNLQKFKEILLYVLAEVGSKPNVGETVLNKLFYFIDFDYYEKYEEQLIGATYQKNRFGPTPRELVKVVEDMKKNDEIQEIKIRHFGHSQKRYCPLRKPNLNLLSAREIKHVDDVLNRLSDKNAKEITDYSHGDIPYLTHQEGENISYESVFYRDEKYSVRSYDDEL